jgi:hypothetical protein
VQASTPQRTSVCHSSPDACLSRGGNNQNSAQSQPPPASTSTTAQSSASRPPDRMLTDKGNNQYSTILVPNSAPPPPPPPKGTSAPPSVMFNWNAAESLGIFIGGVLLATAAAVSSNPALFSASANADIDTFNYLNGTFNPDPTETAKIWLEGFALGFIQYKWGGG